MLQVLVVLHTSHILKWGWLTGSPCSPAAWHVFLLSLSHRGCRWLLARSLWSCYEFGDRAKNLHCRRRRSDRIFDSRFGRACPGIHSWWTGEPELLGWRA